MSENSGESVTEVIEGLERAGYLADEAIANVVFLAERLQKPILLEGPAGTGKTELAKAISRMSGRRLIRLQCYEGLDESKALYEWNYRKQLLRIQADRDSASGWSEIEENIFDQDFLLERPLLEAIRSSEPVVLLVDEVDRLEIETEALLLEILSDFQVSIPELGTIEAKTMPMVVLTSNASRELSEALKRRCLFLFLDYPSLEREKAIVMSRVDGLDEIFAEQLVRIVRSIRELELKKPPSVSETLDWARTLLALGAGSAEEGLPLTLNVLLKHRSDIDRVRKELKVGEDS
ncbi:MAG: ATPase [Acidobacteria bacterium]|nr:MAG: ATPase [Acidobacteriota bacterium]